MTIELPFWTLIILGVLGYFASVGVAHAFFRKGTPKPGPDEFRNGILAIVWPLLLVFTVLFVALAVPNMYAYKITKNLADRIL